MRFSSVRGKPSMRNLWLSLDSISLWINLTVTSDGTIFPSLIVLRIMALKLQFHFQRIHNLEGICNWTILNNGNENHYPYSLLEAISLLNNSPALRCLNPKSLTILVHWVPFPLPGPPESMGRKVSITYTHHKFYIKASKSFGSNIYGNLHMDMPTFNIF